MNWDDLSLENLIFRYGDARECVALEYECGSEKSLAAADHIIKEIVAAFDRRGLKVPRS